MQTEEKKMKKFRLPHVYTIAMALIIIFAILSWIIPSGQFDRTVVDTSVGSKEVAVAGTYHEIDKVDADGNNLRQGIPEILMAPIRGIQAASDVVAFVLLIGGSFGIIMKTNAFNAGVSRVVRRLHNKDIFIIPVVMTLFSIGGTTFGLCEEVLPFYAIFIPLMMKLGYDSMTAFLICFMGPQIGCIAATVNPFSVLISQGIAGIEGNPQLWLRFIQWILFTALAVIWVMLYARRVKRDPQSSITYQDDFTKRHEFSVDDDMANDEFSTRQKLVLLVFAAGIATLVWGLVKKGWYMEEISMIFLAVGLLAGIIGGLSEKEMASTFVSGMKDFTYAAVIIGIARGVLVVAQGGLIIDTILNSLATALAGAPAAVFTSLMFVTQALLTVLVPSGSGMAALTMPIMAPLTELMGLNPEAAVTCLHDATQIMVVLTPTAGMTVAGLAVCKISFSQWWKTCWKFMVLITLLSLVFVAVSGILPV